MKKEIAHFFKEIEVLLTSNLPFVVYRKPNEKKVSCLVQKDKTLNILKEFNESGFVFAPFDDSKNTVIFPFKKCKSFETEISFKSDLKTPQNLANVKAKTSLEKAQLEHEKIVQKAINFIISGSSNKIVLSRKEELISSNLDVLVTLKKMLNTYNNAFVYVWFHPQIGLWMGATPERLLSVSKNVFTTMALAGTQSYKNSLRVNWESKERDEQQFVTNYILSSIQKCVDNLSVSNPYTIKAGNLLHLKTDITGKLKETSLLGDIVKSLHPTPAVCGLPKKVAKEFILKNEGYDRAYYSGFLGELNLYNSTNLFVNLRCMQIENSVASLYIGGGITAESIPQNEWFETVSKAEIMKKVL
ncbi:chorismate-binding protein [uncultured Lutibacter sp.]|uniref:chorismate-binding protein n=1 Tax=uncultured Lutibacter sp. TaxID=437739 RepID=UPI00260AF3D7|nr:chorismate-binding protein [uncultured Lutibacter sp.]